MFRSVFVHCFLESVSFLYASLWVLCHLLHDLLFSHLPRRNLFPKKHRSSVQSWFWFAWKKNLVFREHHCCIVVKFDLEQFLVWLVDQTELPQEKNSVQSKPGILEQGSCFQEALHSHQIRFCLAKLSIEPTTSRKKSRSRFWTIFTKVWKKGGKGR